MALQLFVLIPFAQKISLSHFGNFWKAAMLTSIPPAPHCLKKCVGHFWALFCFTDLFAYLYSNSTIALITAAFIVSLEVR